MKKEILFFLIMIHSIASFTENKIVCAKCRAIIKEGIYYQVDTKLYCSDCYQKHVQILCSYCGLPIEGEYHFDFWGNKFHSHHTTEAPGCVFCGRLIRNKTKDGSRINNNGDSICNICQQTAVQKLEKANLIMFDVSNELKWHGIHLDNKNLTLHLVNKQEMAIVAKQKEINIEQKGLSTHHYSTNSKREIFDSSYNVYALNGLPELHLVKVLAHELMHVWLYQNAPLDNDSQLSEGSCNYAAYLVLQNMLKKPQYRLNQDKKKEIEYLIHILQTNKDPIYGDGFLQVKKMAERMGVSYWLRYIQKYKKLP
jgi:hypothetical protein